MYETPVRCLIVDDNEPFRSGLAGQLASFSDIKLVGEVSSGAPALRQASERQPHVVLLDCSLAEMSGVAVAQVLRMEMPATAVCLLTVAESQQDICTALAAGVRGLLPKESSIEVVHRTLISLAHGEAGIAPSLAIRFLADCYDCCPAPTPSGGRFDALTPHEQVLVYGVAQGWTSQQLGHRCGIAPSTVTQQLQRLLEKLQLVDRQQLLGFAAALGLRTPVAA